MSATAPTAPPAGSPGPSRPASGRPGRPSLPVVLLAVAGFVIALSAVTAITGAHDITSSGEAAAALAAAVPIGMAGLGGLWAERAGVVNIGLEGMMALGTFFGAWGGYWVNPWVGIVAGMAGGALGGLLHALVTVTFGVDHIVSGVGVNLLAVGVAAYLNRIWYTADPSSGAGAKQSPPVGALPDFTVPGLASGLKSVEDHHWFLVSDVAGILGGLVTQVSVVTILALVLVVVTWFLLWRTPFGLRLRSCGENPVAAESLGVNVYRYKYVAVTVSGALAGLGGVFLSMVAAHFYQDGQTAGRGYIGLAAMIFGNWRPGGLAMGAGLFGFTDSLQRRGGGSVHALLLLLAILLAVVALWNLYRRRFLAGVLSVVVAGLVGLWYALTDEIPGEFVTATPYVATLVVLALASQRLRMPKADGQIYRKGQGR